MTIAPDLLARFNRELTRLLPEGGRIGIAVSGGPDSLALLLLAAATRPGDIEAATIDHGLRSESAEEARFVAGLCARLGVPHAILRVAVGSGASLQAQARAARYDALAEWTEGRSLAAVLTAHHADDQAETLLMRLARGSGLAGLSAVRASTGGDPVRILRPLLTWRKSELEAIVADAGLTAVEDPSNADPRHDRTRARTFLAGQEWLDPQRLAASAGHLAEAEEALALIAERLFTERSRRDGGTIHLTAADLPRELQRRLLLLGIAELGARPPRGPDLDRALMTLSENGTCTLAGLQLTGCNPWTLRPAPPRR